VFPPQTTHWGYDTAAAILAAAVSCGITCKTVGPDDREVNYQCCDSDNPCLLRATFVESIKTLDACKQSGFLTVTLELDMCLNDDQAHEYTEQQLQERSTLRWQILMGLLNWRQENDCSMITIEGWESQGSVGQCFRWSITVTVERFI
jgi:hypothetical protein